MPRTKTKPDRKSRNGSATQASAAKMVKAGEVLTLAEAAEYLRVTEPEVLRLLRDQGLPGRSVDGDWRFLKTAVARWLGSPDGADPGRFWKTHFGAFKDDPYLEDIVREAYRQRGRPADGDP